MLHLLALLSCKDAEVEDTGKSVELTPATDCSPISYGYCSVPWPSSYFSKADATSPTGVRLNLGPTTLPYTDQDALSYGPDPWAWNELDGFSPLGTLMVDFPPMSLDGIPGHDDIAGSLADGAPIVIIDVSTGERQPWFAELDEAQDFVTDKLFFIRPVQPFAYGHRYVVGIRNVLQADRSAMPPSDGFKALRDQTETDDAAIEDQRALYEEIFGVLANDGWSRAETILAWDFTVASEQGITGRMRWIRDDVLEVVGTAGPAYVIDTVTDEVDESIYRRINGHFTSPLYTVEDAPGTLLTRDENGQPFRNGETEVPFTILIPRTAYNDARPLPLVQYGHGLLGGQDEVDSSYLTEMAERYGFILFASDWTGMKEEDANAITFMILQDLGQFAMIPERMHQGFSEYLAAARMMTGNLASDDVVKFTPAAGGEPISVVDPTQLYYYGNSQGGIYGGTYMAITPDITRGVLGVPGMPYNLLLSRSADFDSFFLLFASVYDDERDIAFTIGAMQNLWDSADPAGYGPLVNQSPWDDTPAHQILLQDAIGDAQVTTLGAHVMARAYGASLIGTPYEEVWGLPVNTSGYQGSALVEYEHGVPAVPVTNVPPDKDYDTHEDTRRVFAAQEQLWNFLQTGTVVDYCDGVCNPE